ncbi:hypothetical protein Bbelb_351620 [Branchiostoma belcheri]|nr:hypothetical protein Bbelb_351620 [Branchiostoma belcheri]
MPRLVSSWLRLFFLDHHDRRAFYTSPVLKNQTVFVLYRVLAAGFWGSFNVWSLFNAVAEKRWLWFAQATHWGMTLLTAHLVYSAALAWKHWYCSLAEDNTSTQTSMQQPKTTDDGCKLTGYEKTAWILFNLSSSPSFCVTLVYLTLIDTPRYFVGYMEHIVNSVLVIFDIVLSGIPVKMSHFVYPCFLRATYVVFSVVYWALGGLGKNGETYIYRAFRYEEGYRMRTLRIDVVLLLVVVPLMHVACCAFYYLRSWITVNIFVRQKSLPLSTLERNNNLARV